MNAPQPALVAPRPERLRLVGQRRQILAVMHQRLMFGMLVYAGVIAHHRAAHPLSRRVRRPCRPQGRADRASIPERGDIVDRDGQPLARTIDAWTIAVHPTKVIGDKLALAQKLAQLMPEQERRAIFRAAPVGQTVLLSPPPRLAGAGRGGQRARRARPGDRARARPALPPDDARRARARLHRHRRPRRRRRRARVRQISLRPANPRQAAGPVDLQPHPAGARAELGDAMHAFLGDRRRRRGHGRPHRRGAGDDLAAAASIPNAPGQGDARAACSTARRSACSSSARPSSRSRWRWRWTRASSPVPGQMYNCPQVLPAYGHLVHDTHPFGRHCSVAEIMMESSNIGMAQIADKLGKDAAEGVAQEDGLPRQGRDRAEGARPAADAGLPLGPVRDDDHRLRPGHRGRAAAAGDGLCDPVQRRHLSSADDPQGRPRPSAARRAGACSPPTPATACARCCGWS